jgi:TRAP-type C4-dicarboxylate transport system permease small subunit
MNNFYKTSEIIKHYINLILGNASAYLMIAVTLFALIEIIRRYIFGLVFVWGQDAMIYSMVSSVALYICVTQIKRGHLVMSAFLQLLNAKGFHRTVGFCKIFVSLFVSVFTGSLTYTAVSTIEYSIKIGELTESLYFYMWPFYFILALGMGLMCVVGFLQFIEDIHSYIKGDHFTQVIEVATDV